MHHPVMKAYSVDLRERIGAAVRGRMSKPEAARTFGVGATSVKRYVSLAEQGRSLEPGKAPGKQSKLGGSGMKLLEEDLHTRPTATYTAVFITIEPVDRAAWDAFPKRCCVPASISC